MFRWYQNAAKCYVYLSDISIGGSGGNSLSSHYVWKPAFRCCRWFSRGWTLQELIAPTSVEFFSMDGERLGDKNSLSQTIHEITGITVRALQGSPLSQFSFDERMAWAARRETKREEDAAYSLLGIFDVHMPLIYGEGREKAFNRLQKEFRESSEDDLAAPILFPNAMGVPDLFGACIDILERADAYKEFGVESRSMIARFDADKLRFRRWANEVGIFDGKCKEKHDHWLNDRELESAVKRILISTCEIFDAAKLTHSKLRDDCGENDGPLPAIPGVSREITKIKTKSSPSTSIRGGIDWDYKRRGMFTNHIDMFSKVVEMLYNLIPPKNSGSHLLRRPTRLLGHVDGRLSSLYSRRGSLTQVDEQIQDRSGPTSVQSDVQLLLNDMRRRARLQSQNAVNDWLDFTKFDDRYNGSQFYDKQVSSHLEGTCEWIFSHPAYCGWMSNESPDETARLLWICASPGYGKTILCARLVEHFKGMQSFPVAYFFASPHAQSGGEPTFIIRSWIAQIAQLDSDILELLRGHSEAGQRASDSDVWSIFGSVVSHNCNYAFILDGFDEYNRSDDVRTEFLQRLKKAIKGTTIRILILSRDETDIRAELSPEMAQETGQITFQCRISQEDVRHDISLFSRSVVDKKLPKKDNSLRQNLAGQLAERCEGMFLWIKLQQDQFRGGKNAKQLQAIVQNMPIGLTKTYERNWRTIQSHPPEEQARALAILRWTTFALRPLTVAELTEALIVDPNDDGTSLRLDELPDNFDDEYIDSEIIDICGALVEARKEKSGDGASSRTIHLIHPSVREFLLSALSQSPEDLPNRFLDFNQTPAEHHNYLGTVCLTYLNYNGIWQGCEVQIEHEYKYHFIHYATRYWNVHITTAEKDDDKVISLVNEFFRLGNGGFDQWRKYIESPEVTADGSQEREMDAGTPLYYASLFNLTTSMKSIWAGDETQLNIVGGKYGSPLQAVCFKGHALAFDLLVRWGANPNKKGGKFGVPINAAITGAHRSIVKVLVRMGVNLALQDSMGRTPLYTAAMNGNSEIVDILIEAGAELTTSNKYGWTPLNLASDRGHLEVVRLLLDKGADVAVANNDGWTPLNSASNCGHLEVVRLLLSKGADVAVANNNGWTPLDLASDNGHFEVVKLLLENVTDVNCLGGVYGSLINTLAFKGDIDSLRIVYEKYHANQQSVDSHGRTPLQLAARSANIDTFKYLISLGLDPKPEDKKGDSLINYASSGGSLQILDVVLENGLVSSPQRGHWTPLHWACRIGNPNVVERLVKEGFRSESVTITQPEGKWSPVSIAILHGHGKMLERLSAASRSFLDAGTDSSVADVVYLIGRRHSGYWCSGCFHVSS